VGQTHPAKVPMKYPHVALLLAFLSSHITWRASRQLESLHEWERPLLIAGLGVGGPLLIQWAPIINMVCVIATFAWGFINLAWYVPPAGFIFSGIVFALGHGLLSRLSFRYMGSFAALGTLLGLVLVVLSQALLWLL